MIGTCQLSQQKQSSSKIRGFWVAEDQTRGAWSLIFSTPTPLLCIKTWLLFPIWLLVTEKLSTPVLLFNSCHKSRQVQLQIDINISKALLLKITPAPVCWKTPTPSKVEFCTTDPTNLWARLQQLPSRMEGSG